MILPNARITSYASASGAARGDGSRVIQDQAIGRAINCSERPPGSQMQSATDQRQTALISEITVNSAALTHEGVTPRVGDVLTISRDAPRPDAPVQLVVEAVEPPAAPGVMSCAQIVRLKCAAAPAGILIEGAA